MLFWIFVILSIIAILTSVICERKYLPDEYSITSGIIAVILSIIAAIMLICIVAENVNIDGKIASYEQEYEALYYQISNDIYNNDNDIGKKELYNQIMNWNKHLAYAKKAQNDFWIGIFYADIYDDFDYIYLPQE